MTRKFRLAGVLRAREVRKDQAIGAVARARADIAAAIAKRDEREERLLRDLDPNDDDTAAAYMATLATRQAMASELALADQLVVDAGDAVRARTAELTQAAIHHRSLEKLAERQTATQLHTELAAVQRELDETAVSHRSAAQDGTL